MTTETLPDIASMTAEEMDEWIAAEDAKIPFASFDLGTDEGRQELLRKYYMIGNSSLFEAVSHVWSSLNEPRALYCTRIGVAAGTGGKGKRGLVLALQKFLQEALESINWVPSRSDFATVEEWHEASMRTFEDDEEHLEALLVRFSAILNNGLEVKDEGPPSQSSTGLGGIPPSASQRPLLKSLLYRKG